MSFVADSPVHSSSSSDDFASFLDSHIDAASSSSSSSDSDFASEPEIKRARVEEAPEENVELALGSSTVPLLEQSADAVLSRKACSHPGSFGGMCISCGQRMEEESGVTFAYIHKGLRLGNDEIVRLRTKDLKALGTLKKLYLVLDLDHTLLNSTHYRDLVPEEEYLKSQADSLQDVSKGSLFMLDFMGMVTKLRPFVHTFLEEASKMFEMYIYTMGERAYAHEMAKLLDPRQEYFTGRVISRDDGTGRHEKRLDIVLGQESAVLILDDTEMAWTKHKENLILMERYHFFASSCRQFKLAHKSLSVRKEDESEHDGMLASVLEVLKKVHNLFFHQLDDDHEARDVKQVKGQLFIEAFCSLVVVSQVLKMVRKDILKGCNILFSHIFHTDFPANDHPLWKMAEQLGATCSTVVHPSVTHVICSEKSKWALKHNKYVVNRSWIEAANILWQKQPEEKFPLTQTES